MKQSSINFKGEAHLVNTNRRHEIIQNLNFKPSLPSLPVDSIRPGNNPERSDHNFLAEDNG
ncbi:unnamed protein product, partial [Allacma fusca]